MSWDRRPRSVFLGSVLRAVPGALPLSRRERARSSGARRVWQGLFARATVAHAEGFFESVVV